MVLKGLLVVVSGFVFIFCSGIPMHMISRFRPDYKREAMYWGIVIWVATFLISTFLQNFAKQIITGGQAVAANTSVVSYLFGDVITTLLLQLGMLIFLNKRLGKDEDIESDGLALGFGIGLIAQVFTGLNEIGVGVRMVLQNIGNGMAEDSLQTETIANIANASFTNLLFTSLATIMFRVALLTISATQGYLVASAIKRKNLRFWIAALLYIFFTWGAVFLQLALGEKEPGQILGVTSTLTAVAMLVFYSLLTYFSYRWLSKELQSSKLKKQSKRSK
jgi:hypothetical protein